MNATDLQTLVSTITTRPVCDLDGTDITITQTVTVHFTSSMMRPVINGRGGVLRSAITDGSPVLRIVVDPGCRVYGLIIDGLTILGSGSDGNLLQIDASDNSGSLYEVHLNDLLLKGGGGDGLHATGSFFESWITASCATDNKGYGAYFAHGMHDAAQPQNQGILSNIVWDKGSIRDNAGGGLATGLDAYDLSLRDLKFVGNGAAGLIIPNGITLVSNCNFENNTGSAIVGANFAVLENIAYGSSAGTQTALMDQFYVASLLQLRNVRGSHPFGTLTGSGRLDIDRLSDQPGIAPGATITWR